MCPVLPGDLGNTVVLPGKRGPKGEPGSPGNGERGLPVSPTLETSPFSVTAVGVQPRGDPAAPVRPLAEIGTPKTCFIFLSLPWKERHVCLPQGCVCAPFFLHSDR